MHNREEYFKLNNTYTFVTFIIGLILGFMVFFSGVVRAEENKTIDNPLLLLASLDGDKWSTQLIYDTTNACFQGTVRWIVMSNPALIGQRPPPMAQRQMIEHCFCVMDNIRKLHKVEEYIKIVPNQELVGNLFMVKAIECVEEHKTLPSFFSILIVPTIPSDNETTTNDNETKNVIPEDKPKDSQDELPGQKPIESENGLPETIFQG